MAIILLIDNSPENAIASELEKSSDIEYQRVDTSSAALEQIVARAPDLLLVHLPSLAAEEQDTLRIISQQHARLPIVVVSTLQDCDEAVPVVQHIAAHYVPSGVLASELAPTIRRVLEISRRHCDHLEALQTAQELSYRFMFGNDRRQVPPLVAFLQNTVQQLGLCDASQVVRVGVALDEALTNAVYHGNLELDSEMRESDSDGYYRLAAERAGQTPYCDRRVALDVAADRERVIFRIRDEGSGFDPSVIGDPTHPSNLERASGRGIFLMHSFMDEVRYNKLGNEVTMVKTRVAEGAEEA